MIVHDQFYTVPHAVQLCLDHLRDRYSLEQYQLVEPSAGTGEFLKHIPDALAVDIDPRADGIEVADFLTWEPPVCSKPLAFVGNPPFGKNSSVAVKFFNRAAHLGAVWIAFIVPRTFRKISIQRRLHAQYHLQSEIFLPLDSFYTVDGPRSVSCVFQIWERGAESRSLALPPQPVPWVWCGQQDAEVAIRRVGGVAGKIIPVEEASPSSHFYARDLPPDFRDRMTELYDLLWKAPGENAKWDVAGNPSLTKSEIAEAWHTETGK